MPQSTSLVHQKRTEKNANIPISQRLRKGFSIPAWLCRVEHLPVLQPHVWAILGDRSPHLETSLMWLMPTCCVLGAAGFTPQGLQDASHPLLLLLPSSCTASLCSWLGHPVPPCDSSGQVDNSAPVGLPQFGKSPTRHCSLYICEADVTADNGRPDRSSSVLLGRFSTQKEQCEHGRCPPRPVWRGGHEHPATAVHDPAPAAGKKHSRLQEAPGLLYIFPPGLLSSHQDLSSSVCPAGRAARNQAER